MMKWILIALGVAIFAGTLFVVDDTQSRTEFRLAEAARDGCYGDAGYSPFGAARPSTELITRCTQPIRDYESRWTLRTGLGALAGLLAALVYAFLVLAGRRLFVPRGGEPAEA